MKNIFLILGITLFTAAAVNAQRMAYVDVERIMDRIPEYQSAQQELEQVSAKWKQEISKEYTRIDDMYRRFQAERPLLSNAETKRKEDEIVNKEKSVREMQKKRFGPEGDLFNKRKQLVQPIQDRVYRAIESYASERGYDLILDKSSGTNILYAAQKLDKTDDILKKLGVN